MPNSFEDSELKNYLLQLDTALFNHEQWHNKIIRALIFKLPAAPHDLQINAHTQCNFGRWYYDSDSKKLQTNKNFIALGSAHQQMHEVATKLLIKINEQGITLDDYDEFIVLLNIMRLKLLALHTELTHLLYDHDTLTGAFNRRKMLSMLLEQQTLIARNNQSCTLAMFDLDNFKRINDEYGHASGDMVLKKISAFVRHHVRLYDKVFRLGGDEFLICFQQTDVNFTFEMVERLRMEIAAMKIHINNKKTTNITVSFGIASLEPDCLIEQSIVNADKALYEAKNNGRNTTRIWDKRARID